MSRLDLSPRLADPDGLFAALAEAHAGLSETEARRFDARLLLLLANHIGDALVLRQAIAEARKDAHTIEARRGGP